MKTFLITTVAGTIALLAALASPANAQSKLKIIPSERWSCVFGDSEVTFHFEVRSGRRAANASGRIQWQHSANQRTISRGESAYRSGDTAEVTLRIPDVRDGVVFDTLLTVSFVADGADAAEASCEKRISIFPEDAFADQRESIRKASLLVFDPDRSTTDLFEDIELPHKRVTSSAALEDVKPGSIILIGEATSLRRNRSLADRLFELAESGCRVVVLSPIDGNLPTPGSTASELRFRRQHVIRDFDKKLDVDAWPGLKRLPGTGISLATRLGRLSLEVSEDGDWPWMEVRYPESGGVLYVCGFSLIEHWNSGPTPRFLLARIIQKLLRD